MKLFLSLLALMFLLYSCSSLKTEKITSTNKLKSYSFFYNLPKSNIDVIIKAEKQKYTPGPFKDYANKYLGIENVKTSASENWKITDVNISTSPQIDSSNYYAVLYKGRNIIKSLSMQQSFLKSINSNYEDNYANSKNSFISNVKKVNYLPAFTNQTIKPLFVEEIDTSYRIVYRDSVARRIPVYNRKTAEKNIDEQAKDAAKFIIKLRKRRLRVLTAKDKELPKNEAANRIINELNKLEKEYLELFIGKIETKKYEYHYKVVPTKNVSNYKICNFSQDHGFTKNGNKEINLILKNESYNMLIDTFLSDNIKSKTIAKGLYYRLPQSCIVNLNLDDKSIFSSKIEIAQFGNILILSKNQIKNKSIVFDTNTGAIKSLK